MTHPKLAIARLAGWGLSLALLLGAAEGHAQSDADKATARDLANEGQAALDADDFPKAIDRFARADALFPAPTLKLALARAQVGGRKLVAASETYQAIIREGTKPEDPEQFREAVATATQELDQLKPRIPVVVILVEGGQNPEVVLDGAPFSTAGLGVKRIIDPGRHTARATAPGMAPAEQTFDLAESASATIRLELRPAAGAPPPPVGGPFQPGVPPPPPEEEDSGGSILTPIGAIALGLGGAGLVVGGITGILALTNHDTLTKECNSDKECPDDMTGTLDDYRTFGDVSTVTFIVGGVLAAGGITLLIVGASSGGDEVGRREAPLLSLTPYMTPTGGGIWGTF